MMRLTKESDYAIVLLIRIVEEQGGEALSARDLAADVDLPAPIAGKVLKALARGGLLESQRGVRGGYRLALDSEAISVADIITVIEGPIALTACQADEGAVCMIQDNCSARRKWGRINQAIQGTLEQITLAEMARPLCPVEALVEATPLALAASHRPPSHVGESHE